MLPRLIQETGTSVQVDADAWALAAFSAYLLFVVVIGVIASRRSSEGLGSFFLAGRSLNRWVVALSAVVSGRSAWLLLGVSGMAFTRGLSALWAVAGYTLVEALLFLYYAPRLRRASEEYDAITVTDYLAGRFPGSQKPIRIVFSVIIVAFMVGYISSQFVAGGKAFGSSFGISATAGIALTSVIVLGYTVTGGFLAVSLTDMVQAVLMAVALIVLPVLATARAGGVGEVLATVSAVDTSLIDPLAISVGVAIGFLGIGLGSPGQPQILVRYMSIKNPADLKAAAVVATVWNSAMALGAVAVGLVGRVYFPDVASLPNGDTENLFPAMAMLHLHPALFGVVVASIFAAIMSSADSQLLVGVSSVVRDCYQKAFGLGSKMTDRQMVTISRLTTVLIVLAALLLGFVAEGLVFWLVLFAWAGLGAAIGPTTVLALFWKGTTGWGVIVGAIAGTIVTVVWESHPVLQPLLYELVPGFAAGLLTTWLVSLMTAVGGGKNPPPE